MDEPKVCHMRCRSKNLNLEMLQADKEMEMEQAYTQCKHAKNSYSCNTFTLEQTVTGTNYSVLYIYL